VNEILFRPTRQELWYRSRQTSLMTNPTKGRIWQRTEVTRKGCLRNPRAGAARCHCARDYNSAPTTIANKLGKALSGADSMLLVSGRNS
jgi:hypothetical protein